MAIIVDINDGMAVSQFELKLPAPSKYNINDLIAYVGSELSESVRGMSTHLHRFSTRSTIVVDNLLRSAMSGGTPIMRFRLGFGTPTNMIWLPWQEHLIRFYSGILESSGDEAGHHLELETVDALYTMSRVNKVTVRRGTIGNIVRQIAQENGLSAVVEDTESEYAYIQHFMDDTHMLFERLRPRAVNEKGRGNYVCYVKDGVLHFHSPDYQADVKDLYYYQSPYVSLAQADRSQRLWDEGISGTRLVVYDPYTAESRTVASDPEKALRLADGIYNLSAVTGAERNIFYNLSLNRPEEAVALSQNAYELARSQSFEVMATFTRLITVRVGDIIRLVVTPSDQVTSPWSGYYLLAKAVTTVEKGAVHVICSLQRGEIQKMQAERTVQSANNQLVPVTEAPGQDLNLRTTQDSSLTRGAGNRTSTSVYATVVDANTLPTG